MSGNNTKFYVLYDSELMMENDAVICEFVYKFVGLKKKEKNHFGNGVYRETQWFHENLEIVNDPLKKKKDRLGSRALNHETYFGYFFLNFHFFDLRA